MKRASQLLLGVVAWCSACATPPPPTPPVSSCSLEAETACVAYGATVAGVPARPSAQLIVGLSDRAADMEATSAIDYWRRIEEIHSSSELRNEVVDRRAAASYAALAEIEVSEVEAEGGTFEETVREGQVAVERVRELAAFAVTWGSPAIQLQATYALARAYRAQARNLEKVELPAELTLTGRAALGQKRDAIAGELRAQADQLDEGAAKHCRRHQLTGARCAGSKLETEPEL